MDRDKDSSMYLLSVASGKSIRASLSGIRSGKFLLNEHRRNLLSRVPDQGDYVRVELNSLKIIDLAYLSAQTGDEFAILRSKQEDILFHGTPLGCTFTDELEDGIRTHKYYLVGHSHPGEEEPEPSLEDRTFLLETGQARSTVVSARTGKMTDYTSDPFEGGYKL